MCPDPQLLSIYLDGELPSPWKEKMQEHFSQCPKCKEKLENFKRLQELFKKDKSIKRTFVERVIDEPAEPRNYTELELLEADRRAIAESQARVWERIEANRSFRPRYNLLQRRLSIPLPAVAAAAVLILLMTFLWLQRPGSNADQENTGFMLAAEMDYIDEYPNIIPAADMSGVLQYLTPNAGTNIIILQLPENKDFFRASEPAIIRAADFSRRGP